MIPRLTEHGVEFITMEQIEADWRLLKEVAERLNCTRDGAHKAAACANVFGRRFPLVMTALRELLP